MLDRKSFLIIEAGLAGPRRKPAGGARERPLQSQPVAAPCKPPSRFITPASHSTATDTLVQFRGVQKTYDGRTLVVHGHWAMRGVYRGKATIGLDSGCVYGGRLTAWCQEEDRTIDVPGRSR